MPASPCQATTNNEDLCYILKTLFLEQRCKLRGCTRSNAVDTRNASLVAKSVLVRRSLYLHLKSSFPKFATECDAVMAYSFYEDKFGVLGTGMMKPGFAGGPPGDDGSDDEKMGAPVASAEGGDHLSTYTSKAPG